MNHRRLSLQEVIEAASTFEDELEEAAELLIQQEPPDARRLDPATPTDYGDPSLIDPAD
jgi:hypothetical protein